MARYTASLICSAAIGGGRNSKFMHTALEVVAVVIRLRYSSRMKIFLP